MTMNPCTRAWHAAWALPPILLAAQTASADTAVVSFQQRTTLSNPCAVFQMPQPDGVTTRIMQGEDIDFDLRGTVQTVVEMDSDGGEHLKLQVKAHGEGTGLSSGIRYRFSGSAVVKSHASVDIFDPSFELNEKIRLDARIIGEGNDASEGGIAQGAQDNATVSFALDVRIRPGYGTVYASEFEIACAGSPWSNLMEAREAKTKSEVGRGFGDPWNKYAWSMKAFGGALLVGTKNAYYDGLGLFDDDGAVGDCIDSNFYQVTDIHEAVACAELFGAPNSGTYPPLADARDAEIWRFDLTKKTWGKVYDEAPMLGSQGFRSMEIHNGKLFAGSDLGAFITGVDLYEGSPYAWSFPGSQLLVSLDGKSFERIASCETSGPCTSASGVGNPYGILGPPGVDGAVNTSIRAMASYDGKLFVGTFNVWGGQLWSYDDTTDTWAFVHQFLVPDPDPFKKPAVAELVAYKDKLYIGLAGPAGNNYLYAYDGTSVAVVPGQPFLPPTNFGTLKLFASSKGTLYVGNLDLVEGFTLQTFDGSSFSTITTNGFFNSLNAYPWSMEEVDGRVFLGTFSQDFMTSLPRGPAELWYSDDDVAWQQVSLPVGWALWNYGVRTMEVANKQLFLGAASNIVAPDLTVQGRPTALSPGAEVWSVRTTTIGPSRKTMK